MIGQGHIAQLERVISDFDPKGANRYFVFGSSVRRDRFRDIDIGVLGNRASRKRLSDLRDRFYESTLPYTVDVVDFDDADAPFRDYVLRNEPIVWMK
jgi:predicted nucleotidyltransferase